ncbi:hypothetical protein ACQP3L_37915, partial [Escherichia coli]
AQENFTRQMQVDEHCWPPIEGLTTQYGQRSLTYFLFSFFGSFDAQSLSINESQKTFSKNNFQIYF